MSPTALPIACPSALDLGKCIPPYTLGSGRHPLQGPAQVKAKHLRNHTEWSGVLSTQGAPHLLQPTSELASEKEPYVRGASLTGAYSLPTVKVMLSAPKYLCGAQCYQFGPCLPHALVGAVVRAEEETGCERDLARICPDAPAVTACVLGYSGCAGVFSSGVQVGSAWKPWQPRLHSSSQMSCTAVSRINEPNTQVLGPEMCMLIYRT